MLLIWGPLVVLTDTYRSIVHRANQLGSSAAVYSKWMIHVILLVVGDRQASCACHYSRYQHTGEDGNLQ